MEIEDRIIAWITVCLILALGLALLGIHSELINICEQIRCRVQD